MACPACLRRAALLAPAIERLTSLTRPSLLGLLALREEERLCRAVGVRDPRGLLRRVAPARGAPGAPCALCRHDPAYPVTLAQLDSAPAVLHATCDLERLLSLLAAPTVALVGDRFHTDYAHRVTFALARDLATAGVTLLSGLHQGLDGIAHHGALHAGGRSLAVVGCAPELPHPRQLEHLHRRLVSSGAVVSEFPPGFFPPRRWCLLASQRLIAALADVVVIVEAGKRSPTLLCALVAADLGRDVAVVPGRVTDPGALGTLSLLRDGAHPVAYARDVLELLPSGLSGRAALAQS